MSRWQDRVDELLFEGESVKDTVDVDSAQVVVTSHRVLVFTPELDGENFRQADRPNVAGVETGSRGNASLLGRGIKVGVVGVVLLLAGIFIDFGSLVGGLDLSDTEGAGQIGIGSILDATQGLLDLITQLDYLLRVFGALALSLGIVFAGVYWMGREPTLVIKMAGDERDIHVPRPENASETSALLDRAIIPGTVSNAVEDVSEQPSDGWDEPL